MKKLKIGDWVEVRSKEEILQTLNKSGMLDGMPFMPEMLKFCGQKFRVYKSAHKTCDYSAEPYACRNLGDSVHLETRCDGEAHSGCQAGCLLYWKKAWLKPVEREMENSALTTATSQSDAAKEFNKTSGCTEKDLWDHLQEPTTEDGTPTYICQMTQIRSATTPLAWWDLRQYIEDYLSGNVTFGRILSGLIYWIYFTLSNAGIKLGRPLRWFYANFNPLWGGTGIPRKPGLIPHGIATPTANLNLQPGELVRVKTQEQILQSVDTSNRNRGMYWDAELVPYCGKTFRVLRRVSKQIGERTRKMQEMKSPCVVLESAICQARYSSCRMFCPKSMFPYWREIWLERVEAQEGDALGAENSVRSSVHQERRYQSSNSLIESKNDRR